MNLAQLTARLTAAAAGGVSQTAGQLAHDTASGLEAAVKARRKARSVILQTAADNSVSLSGAQPFGVYQEGYGPGLPMEEPGMPGLDAAAQQMAADLAAAAAALITGKGP